MALGALRARVGDTQDVGYWGEPSNGTRSRIACGLNWVESRIEVLSETWNSLGDQSGEPSMITSIDLHVSEGRRKKGNMARLALLLKTPELRLC